MTGLLMSNLDETFTEASKGCPLLSDTISRSNRNLHVLLDSRKKLKRTDGVLTRFLKSNLEENFTKASKECPNLSDTICRLIRNLNVLQDSSTRLRGQVES